MKAAKFTTRPTWLRSIRRCMAGPADTTHLVDHAPAVVMAAQKLDAIVIGATTPHSGAQRARRCRGAYPYGCGRETPSRVRRGRAPTPVSPNRAQTARVVERRGAPARSSTI